MSEEREGEAGVVADSTEALVDNLLGLVDGVEAEDGEFATFEIAPDLFDRNAIMTTRQLVSSNPPTDRRRESPGHFPPLGGMRP